MGIERKIANVLLNIAAFGALFHPAHAQEDNLTEAVVPRSRVSVTLSRVDAVDGIVYGPNLILPCPEDSTGFNVTDSEVYTGDLNPSLFEKFGLLEKAGRISPSQREIGTYVDSSAEDSLYSKKYWIQCITNEGQESEVIAFVELKLID